MELSPSGRRESFGPFFSKFAVCGDCIFFFITNVVVATLATPFVILFNIIGRCCYYCYSYFYHYYYYFFFFYFFYFSYFFFYFFTPNTNIFSTSIA